jgi:hypothetical protein
VASLIAQLVASSSVAWRERRFVLRPFGSVSGVVELEAREFDVGDAEVARKLRVLDAFELGVTMVDRSQRDKLMVTLG